MRGGLPVSIDVSPTVAADRPVGSRPRAAVQRRTGLASAAWAWPAAALAIVAISLAPFLVVDAPAVLDYPNHLARFYILAHPHDPVLSRMYEPHWAVLPNVGADVLGWALLSILPAHVGGRILLAMSLLAPPAGAVLYARAAFGRWTWWSLGAGVIAYNGVFFWGFMNFELGVGVALAGAAAWRVLRRQGRNGVAVAAGAVIGLCAFFCHLVGFGFFALLIGAQEVEPLLGQWRRGRFSWRETAVAAARPALALAPCAALYFLAHRAGNSGDVFAWDWGAKLVTWLTPFMIYSTAAIVVTAALVLGAVLLLRRHMRLATGVRLALVCLVAAVVVAPFYALGSGFVDARPALMAALLLFAGAAPQPPPGLGRRMALVFAALIPLRAAIVAANWAGHARDLAELRAQLAYVPPGAKILPAFTQPPRGEETSGRELSRMSRINDHIVDLAIIERHTYSPDLFADPAQQPLVVRAPYKMPQGWSAPWADLYPETPANLANEGYMDHWRRHFDFVLLTGPPPEARRLPAGLALVRAGAATSLYRVVR